MFLHHIFYISAEVIKTNLMIFPLFSSVILFLMIYSRQTVSNRDKVTLFTDADTWFRSFMAERQNSCYWACMLAKILPGLLQVLQCHFLLFLAQLFQRKGWAVVTALASTTTSTLAVTQEHDLEGSNSHQTWWTPQTSHTSRTLL